MKQKEDSKDMIINEEKQTETNTGGVKMVAVFVFSVCIMHNFGIFWLAKQPLYDGALNQSIKALYTIKLPQGGRRKKGVKNYVHPDFTMIGFPKLCRYIMSRHFSFGLICPRYEEIVSQCNIACTMVCLRSFLRLT